MTNYKLRMREKADALRAKAPRVFIIHFLQLFSYRPQSFFVTNENLRVKLPKFVDICSYL